MSDPQRFDFSSQEIGDQVAAAWERYHDRLFEGQRELSNWLVDHIDPKPGQTVLELAAGPGSTGFLAAERVQPGGRLICTDISPRMLEGAKRAAAKRGVDNVEFSVMDAQQIDLPDASVDGVVCRFGIMLLPEPARALEGCRRVLRAGGRIAYGVWGPPEHNPWLGMLAMAILQHGHAPPFDPFGPGGPFSLPSDDANRPLLDAAGFVDVEVHEIPGVMHYEKLDDYWDFQTAIAGPLAVLASTFTGEQTAEIKATLEGMIAPFRTEDGYDLPSLAVGVCAAVPGG